MRKARIPERRKPRRPAGNAAYVAWVAVAVAALALGSIAAVAGAGRVAALSPACGGCHPMARPVETWQASSHSKVACFSCHDAAYAWYDFPGNLFGSASMLRRTPDATGTADGIAVTAIDDAVCGQCHDPDRAPSSGGRILIDHVEHAKRNRSCLSCHRGSMHPDFEDGPDRERRIALFKMSECYVCHGASAYPTASRTCATCHPDFFELAPESHRTPTWASPDHGTTARADQQQCTMCHIGTLCTDCHGIEMPHPDGFRQTHAEAGRTQPDVCARCHAKGELALSGAGLEFCNNCHHEGSDPSRPWLQQHPGNAMSGDGPARCFACHSPTYCAKCHIRSSR